MTDSLHPLLQELAVRYGLELKIEEDSVHLYAPNGTKNAQLDLVVIRRLAQQAERHDVQSWMDARFKMAAQALASSSQGVQPSLLLPHIRPMRQPGEPHWSQPLANDQLSVALVEDRGETLRLMQPMQLVQTGHSIQQLLDRANAHLQTITSPIHIENHPTYGCLHCTASDGHSASRALIAHRLIHDPAGWLFLVPSRDELWLIPASTPQALERGLALKPHARRHAMAHAYPISAELFANRQGRIQHLPGPIPSEQ